MTMFSRRDFPPLPSYKTTRSRWQISNHAIAHVHTPRPLGSATTINDLPDELILEILDHLPGIDIDDFQLSTLVCLSLTNHRFHRMVAERLYATYSSHFCEPYLFLRTMVAKPQLAELVRYVDVTCGDGAHHDRNRYVATAQDKKTIKEGMRLLSISNWKTWAVDCNSFDGEVEVLHSAVLMHAPNIKSLVIEDTGSHDHTGPKWIDIIRKATIGTSSGRVHRFEHLQSVRVGASRYNTSQLAPLFRLDSLRLLHLRDLVALDTGGRSTTVLQRMIPQDCNRIEKLNLEHSFLHMDTLGVLVASSRRLKIFKYDVTLECISHELNAHHELGATKLSMVLHPKRDSLESLHLSCDARAEEETRGTITLLDDLRNFVALKHLSCPLTSIIGARLDASATFIESLPRSLITYNTVIRKYTDDKNCLTALEHMAANYHTNTQKLEEVRIVVPSPAPWLMYDWEPLVRFFSRSGVNLVVEHEEDDEDDFGESWNDDSTESSQSSDEVDLYSNEG
ncbi:uncharacterized protein K460DRAFT_366990 [Cucurbitaria berberidis CBS 394.84]|uniref:F-box domain-containing protein n=1 Tax=Cucurbitaria berberidis CBS 394.84 TaxID=1168544 RepID=A0A9P4GIM9_9PLEO|nr:uncharacterized protein K460DRAFT_366990 [Cucurbitaria berberidis CBS 394.84]KAF1846164.1 hypothetical protein K460DRAFT_366990 [Cucurbitaria berberidis CBS 394.84]